MPALRCAPAGMTKFGAARWSRQLLSQLVNGRCGVKPKPAAEDFSNLQDFGVGGGFELAGINRHRQHGVVPDCAS